MSVGNEHRAAVARTFAIGFPALALVLPALPRAGLAVVAFTALGALLVGVPAANAAWRTGGAPFAGGAGVAGAAARSSLGTLVALLLAALWLAPIAAQGATGAAVAVGCWLGGLLLAVRPAAWALPPVLCGLLLLASGAATSMLTIPPWTLLEPHWSQWETILGPALTAGILAAGCGTAYFTTDATRPPGNRHAPWATAGVMLLCAVMLSLIAGARFEAGVVAPSLAIDVATALIVTAVTAAFCAHGAQDSRRQVGWDGPRLRALVGLLTTLALAASGPQACAFLATTLLPACALGVTALCALGARGGDRAWLVLASAALAVGIVMSWPGWPAGALEAVVIGACMVLAFWFVATRSVRAAVVARRPA